MAYSERLLENQERLSMRDMRLRVAKLILRGVASSTIAQAEGYPSYTARELSSYFSYSSISISSKPEPELLEVEVNVYKIILLLCIFTILIKTYIFFNPINCCTAGSNCPAV